MPSQAKGTLKGIRFKLGGAFAGYFVLVLTILVLLPPEPRPPQEEQVWTLYADYGFSDKAGSSQLLTVQTIPRNPTPTEDGRLRYKLVGENRNGEWRFPDLRIGHENYITESILLDEHSRKQDSIMINREEKTIHITEPIILEKEQFE